MSQTDIYATKADLLAITNAIESKFALKYVRSGFSAEPSFPVFERASEIDGIGRTSSESWVGATSYLVMDRAETIHMETKSYSGVARYGVYEGNNPLAISLSPSGILREGFLIYGRFATMGLSPEASRLYRRFTTVVKKTFTRVGSAYLGPEAYELLRQGWRLAQAVQNPPECSVRLPDAVISSSEGEGSNVPPSRLSYEESCRRLQPDYVDAGDIPPMRDRMPRFDDPDPWGVMFFRASVDDGSGTANLTLPRTFMSKSEFRGASFANTDLRESSLCWNDFIEVDFTDACLAGCDLRASEFHQVTFVRTDLAGADLRRSQFVDCDFTDAQMSGAVVSESQRSRLHLSEAQWAEVTISAEGDEPQGG